MKTVIYSRKEISHNADELDVLFNALDNSALDYYVNTDFADIIRDKTGKIIRNDKLYHNQDDLPNDSDLMISYGGDGTFLDSVRLINNRSIAILGINSGHLGFLANVSKGDIALALEQIAQEKYTLEQRIMLEVDGDFGQKLNYPYAFNEFSVQKSGVTMVSVDVYIDDELITTYLGDGILLSTPSGSTAYSLSVGGPIVAPNSNCFVLAPIASHNLTMRPLVIPDTSILRFCVSSRKGRSFATLDNRDFEIANHSVFTIKRAKKSVTLVKLQNISFYRTLRDKMMWGMDNREPKNNL